MSPKQVLILGSIVAGLLHPGAVSRGDQLPFTVELKEVTFQDAPALQSFALAQDSKGRWLCLGGRTAGLHGQADHAQHDAHSASFQNFNDRAWVIDVASKQAKSRALADLGMAGDAVASLAVTGPQSLQLGDKLYIAGGYGYSPDRSYFKTYDQLTVVDVAATVDAVLQCTPVGSHIRQSPSEASLRVTGGALEPLGGKLLLVFGQNFPYTYNKGINGSYTYQVRSFDVVDDGMSVQIVNGSSAGSSAEPEYRRRDLNVVRAIRPDGSRGLTVYGGVFQREDQLPWYRPIDIDWIRGMPCPSLPPGGFRQQLCQYNCAVLPIYQATGRSAFTVFFGGISEVYYDPAQPGGFQRDASLPFVNHVACLGRSPSGMAEWLVCQGNDVSPVPLRLPALLGAAAQFVPIDAGQSTSFDDGVLALDQVSGRKLVGHIFGGILAGQPSNGSSAGSNRIFEVYLSDVPSQAIAVVSSPQIVTPRLPRKGPWP